MTVKEFHSELGETNQIFQKLQFQNSDSFSKGTRFRNAFGSAPFGFKEALNEGKDMEGGIFEGKEEVFK